MKKIIILLSFSMAIALHGQVIFQSDFEDWTAGVPDDWNGVQTNIGAGNFVEYTTSAQSGSSACQLINTTSTHKRFTTKGISITTGENYDVTFWVRGKGEIRTGIYNGLDPNANQYQSYIVVNSSTWAMHTQTVTANATSTTAEIIFSLRNTDASMDHIQIDNIVVEGSSISLDTVSIYNIQYTTNPDGNSPYMGQNIITYGVVTAAGSTGFFIQDGQGPWNGLYIYNNTFTVAPGDSIFIQGRIEEYYTMTEMTQVANVSIVGQGTIPQPSLITTAQVNTEEYESVLVRVMNAECVNTNAGYGMWTVNDGSGIALVDKMFYEFTPTLGVHYNVTGPVMYSFDAFKIEPRSASDIEIYTSVEETMKPQISMYPNPVSDIVKIFISESCDLSITNILGQVVYSVENASKNLVINVSEWQSGIYLVNVTNQDSVSSVFKMIKN